MSVVSTMMHVAGLEVVYAAVADITAVTESILRANSNKDQKLIGN